MKDSKVLAFDLGNVLFNFDYTIALNKIQRRMKISVDEMMYYLYEENFTLPFEKGLVSGPEFYEGFKRKIGSDLTYEEFVDIWCKIFFPKLDVIGLVKAVFKKYPLYLISNINQLHFDYLYKENREVFALFDGLVLSFEVKAIKPEKEIYYALEKAAGAEFKNIIYIDDRQELVLAANLLGLQGLRFIDYGQLVRDLKTLNILGPEFTRSLKNNNERLQNK